jgi:hypothetical protein
LEHLPAVVVREAAQLATTDVVKHVNSIQRVMKAVMKEETHYGKIPGCKGLSLYKAGAEKLCLTFRLLPTYELECIDLPNGHREYKVRCRLTHGPSGQFVAEGVGSCSTMEAKYRWRQSEIECPSCGRPLRKSKTEWYCWAKKGGCGEKFSLDDEMITSQKIEKIENPSIADQYNTVLKMAKKRAYVDATITATSASDIFTQDILDPEVDEEPEATPPAGDNRPRETEAFFERDLDSGPPPPVEERQKRLIDRLKALGYRSHSEVYKFATKNGVEGRIKDYTAANLNVLEKAATLLERDDARQTQEESPFTPE